MTLATMTAVARLDEVSGMLEWHCTEISGRGEVTTYPTIELAAATFAVGATVHVFEPTPDQIITTEGCKMGNHEVGRSMSNAAKVFWLVKGDASVSKDEALAAINVAGEDYIGADAEFEDELYEWTPLSRLVAIAFDATPEEIADLKGELDEGRIEDAGELWYDGPVSRFNAHFKFC